MTRSVVQIAGTAAMLLAQCGFAGAAELKVYSTIGVKSAVEELAPKFEQATGNKLTISWGLISGFTKKAQEGDVPDVLIVSRESIDSLTKDGKIASGGPTLGKSGAAVAVKQGAPKPDISTVDAFKKALLAARSIGSTDPAAGGATGVHFAQVIEKLGIADEVKKKSKYPPPAGFVNTMLLNGEIDLAIQTGPELTAPGIEIVGGFPGEFAKVTVYAAGVGAQSTSAAAANALVKFLASPEAQAVFKAKGFDPA